MRNDARDGETTRDETMLYVYRRDTSNNIKRYAVLYLSPLRTSRYGTAFVHARRSRSNSTLGTF